MNKAAMNNAQESRKRIVSKGEYAANVGKKATLSSFGITLCLLGSAGLVVTLLGIGLFLTRFDLEIVPLFVTCVVVVGGGSAALIRFGRNAVKEASDIAAGVPLTRRNTGDLPTPDSLVRASSEPVRAQQDVLSRASAEAQTGREDHQLLRPADVPKN